MKVSSINSAYCGYKNYTQYSSEKITSPLQTRQINKIQTYQPSFGIANSAPIKTLFKYGLPCIYSGVEMIDPQDVQKAIKKRVFNRPINKAMETFKKYSKSFAGMEKKVYILMKISSWFMKQRNIQEVFQKLSVLFEKILIYKQNAVFDNLSKKFQNLPCDLVNEYNILMKNAKDKIDKVPVIEPFSSYEFKYKLQKIKGNVDKLDNYKATKVMNMLLKESLKFSEVTNSETIEDQKKILTYMEMIFKSSCLKKNDELKTLLQNSKNRINSKPALIPFSRKSFLYDLRKIIQEVPDKEIQESLLNTATGLPTSSDSISAYIVKVAKEPSEKIAYRLLWPFFASVEHILPHSCGGKDEMANFGGATTRENSLRQSIPFPEQMKRRPKSAKYCQEYVDRLIEIVHQGIFKKHKIDTQYIEDFKNTIYTQSKGKINLDTSKL